MAFARFVEHDSDADTDPASGFWSGAPRIIAGKDTYGAEVAGHRTEILSQWSFEALYFLFVCPYQELYLKPSPVTAAETYQLWNWDVAEVFVGSDFEKIRRYKEFEVSPQGEWVDLDIDLDQAHPEEGWLWKSGMLAAARIDHQRTTWYAFMRIPFSALDVRRAACGNNLRINFYRAQGAEPHRKYVGWQPTYKSTFHVPESFGTLKLAAG